MVDNNQNTNIGLGCKIHPLTIHLFFGKWPFTEHTAFTSPHMSYLCWMEWGYGMPGHGVRIKGEDASIKVLNPAAVDVHGDRGETSGITKGRRKFRMPAALLCLTPVTTASSLSFCSLSFLHKLSLLVCLCLHVCNIHTQQPHYSMLYLRDPAPHTSRRSSPEGDACVSCVCLWVRVWVCTDVCWSAGHECEKCVCVDGVCVSDTKELSTGYRSRCPFTCLTSVQRCARSVCALSRLQ